MNKIKSTLTLFALLTAGVTVAQFPGKLTQKLPTTFNKKSLSEEQIGKGLKAALKKGVEKGVDRVSKTDGFFKDQAIKVLMPPDAKKVEDKLRAAGQGKKVDSAIESFNRAAEDASIQAKDIFIQAITSMTLADAKSILSGKDDAATKFLQEKTKQELYSKFEPIIESSLNKVGATKHWETVMSSYNKIPFVKKVNPNLKEYVTNKAIAGLFVQIAKEEKQIRNNPKSRTTDLLKEVFAK
ncbi:MAG: hypothetical protein ACJAZ2_002414 [Glaciecola sp.]|jgi:hypothetical protein